MNVSKLLQDKLEKIATERLKLGLVFGEAGVLSQQQMQDLYNLGADPFLLGGWMSGFLLEPMSEQYKHEESYVRGYNSGLEIRNKLEPKFLN